MLGHTPRNHIREAKIVSGRTPELSLSLQKAHEQDGNSHPACNAETLNAFAFAREHVGCRTAYRIETTARCFGWYHDQTFVSTVLFNPESELPFSTMLSEVLTEFLPIGNCARAAWEVGKRLRCLSTWPYR